MALSKKDIARLAGNDEYARYLLQARSKFEQGRATTINQIQDVYRRAAADVGKDIAGLTPGTLRHGHLSALQKNLDTRAKALNGLILNASHKGIWLSSEAGANAPANVASGMLQEAFSSPDIMRLFAGINERATLAMLARSGRDGLMLSDRVWRTGENYRNAITVLAQDGVARGLDARHLARDVQKYLEPNAWTAHKMDTRRRLGVSKDISYEAMRLARTEMNNAFHEGMVAANQNVPGYLGIYWRLSADHPFPDVCDDMASNRFYGEPGFYPKGNEPARPHPQCFCITVPFYEDPNEFADRLRGWMNDPSSQPDIDIWYNKTGKGFLEKPLAKMWSIPSPSLATKGSTKKNAAHVLKEAEDEIAGRTTEKAIIIDSKGERVLQKDGGRSYVAFTQEDLIHFNGNVFTHNHPMGTSFSWEDISIATKQNVAEMRAVGKEYVYSMKPGKSGWPDHEVLHSTFEDTNRSVKDEFWADIESGKITQNEANKTHWHEVWTRVTKILDMKYARIAR